MYVYKRYYACAPTAEAAASTMFMVWLRAWQKAKQRMARDFTVNLYKKINM